MTTHHQISKPTIKHQNHHEIFPYYYNISMSNTHHGSKHNPNAAAIPLMNYDIPRVNIGNQAGIINIKSNRVGVVHPPHDFF